jgi:hypothetical protein
MSMSDVIPAVIMLVLSAIVILATWSLGYWTDFSPGPAFAPVWIGAAGILLVVLRLLEARSAARTGLEWPDRTGLVRIGLTMGGLVALCVLSPIVGMVPSVALFIAFFLLAVARRRLVPTLATVAVTTGLIYGVFVLWLGLRLPTGFFGV